jgi:hypothetical protein
MGPASQACQSLRVSVVAESRRFGEPASVGEKAAGALQRSVREWAIRQGWTGRSVREEQAQGILVAARGMLAAHIGWAY